MHDHAPRPPYALRLARALAPIACALACACRYPLHMDYIDEDATDTDVDGTDAASGTGDESEGDSDATTGTDSDSDTDAPPDFPPVTEPGPFGVGFRTYDVTYTPAMMDEARTLEVAVWYPTDDASGVPALYFDFVERPDVFFKAKPIAASNLPVLLFSHGNGGLAEQTFSLTEFYASHGWLVISPNHTGNTLIDIDESKIPLMVFLRPQDISRSLDAIASLPKSDPLHDKAGDEVVMSGHSFGGYTTLALAGGAFDLDGLDAQCELDPGFLACGVLADPQLRAQLVTGFRDERVDLAVPLAPGAVALFGDDGLRDLDIPVLLATASLDETTPDVEDGDPAWSGLGARADNRRLRFLTGGHFTFSYACGAGLLEGDGCGPEFIDPDEAGWILNAYAMAFTRAALWGDTSERALLDGQETLSDEVALVLP